MSDKLMDTERGGEQTQYEGAATSVQPPVRDGGTLDEPSGPTEANAHAEQQLRERGEKTAENVRYGQAISETGFGGTTTGNSGAATDREGGLQAPREEGELDAREVQGYGEGSGVGG